MTDREMIDRWFMTMPERTWPQTLFMGHTLQAHDGTIRRTADGALVARLTQIDGTAGVVVEPIGDAATTLIRAAADKYGYPAIYSWGQQQSQQQAFQTKDMSAPRHPRRLERKRR